MKASTSKLSLFPFDLVTLSTATRYIGRIQLSARPLDLLEHKTCEKALVSYALNLIRCTGS